jgi:hypothetical protein
MVGDLPIMSREALSALMERAGSSRLPHDLSRMLGRGVALKGCAMAPRQAGFGP